MFDIFDSFERRFFDNDNLNFLYIFIMFWASPLPNNTMTSKINKQNQQYIYINNKNIQVLNFFFFLLFFLQNRVLRKRKSPNAWKKSTNTTWSGMAMENEAPSTACVRTARLTLLVYSPRRCGSASRTHWLHSWSTRWVTV